MMADPPGGKDDLEARKTRFVPRNDIVDGGAGKSASGNRLTQVGAAPAPSVAPPVETPSTPAGGTVIGRTRLVGLGGAPETPTPMPAPAASVQNAATMVTGGGSVAGKTEFVRADSAPIEPVVGWVVVVKGPGRGAYKPVHVGMNSVGRDPSQRICLDFGDETISREQHAFITYDDELRRYWVQNGGKSNLVRLGDESLVAPAELKGNDVIRIGKTVLRFYPVCGPDFSWTDEVSDA
jgi:hypothetical protein